jgi:AcrR family transcriptional regulator
MGSVEQRSIAIHDPRVIGAESTRSRLQLDERRNQLIELGLTLFSERAYDEVSIDDIAREAGVSKGLLYHYFGGKRDFYVACVRAARDLLLERTQPDLSLPELERARAGLVAYLDFADERAPAYVALMRSGLGNDPEVSSILEEARTQMVERMLAAMHLDEPRPIFRLATRSWIGQVEVACLEWLEKKEVPREALVALLLGALNGTLSTAKLLDPDAPITLEGS